ncbi:ferredoxin [Streptomyces sp. DH37]|uniref:ferredoxin n=1 Tax=Streptomyces sp. DH37 TaxID=3040122 RepID=UPI002441198A|nr:ferredoxin [Streptomyces sp. DH37]MDG9704721.1 ferredoxin [Streptomyces sp. DH37]
MTTAGKGGKVEEMWRIEVDRSACAGTGLCVGAAPEHMRLDGGRARPVARDTAPDQRVADAAETCPMEAIRVRDAATGEVLAPEL